jgi:hypothetical protein
MRRCLVCQQPIGDAAPAITLEIRAWNAAQGWTQTFRFVCSGPCAVRARLLLHLDEDWDTAPSPEPAPPSVARC